MSGVFSYLAAFALCVGIAGWSPLGFLFSPIFIALAVHYWSP